MGEIVKFTFDNVFEEDRASEKPDEPEQDPRELPVYSEIDLEAARAEAFEQGTVVGEQRARDAAHDRLHISIIEIHENDDGQLVIQESCELREEARHPASVVDLSMIPDVANLPTEAVGK